MKQDKSAAKNECSLGSLDQVVCNHISLVKKIAHHLVARLPQSVYVDDLIQAGMIGLLEAALNYDETKGASFSTYAGIRIRGSIIDEMRKGDWAPRSVHKNSRRVNSAIYDLERTLARDVSFSEVADYMNIPLEELHQMMIDTQNTKVMYIEDVGINEESMMQFGTSSLKNPENIFESDEEKDKMTEMLSTLPEKERIVIALYYQEELNLKQIGQILGVTESRVSQILSQGLLKLQNLCSDLVYTKKKV